MEFKESKSKWKDSLADDETLEEMTPEELAEEARLAAKAARKLVRRERRAARAKAERDAKLAEIKKKRQEAAEAAKRGEAPDLDESNVWLFDVYDAAVARWKKSEAYQKGKKAGLWMDEKVYKTRRKITRYQYLTKKFYRRYLGVSPAEAQRRALNASFASSPKTTLMQEYDIDLDHVAYVNLFDKERGDFKTIRNRRALEHLLSLPCVQGQASEVAFLLKADTEYQVEFVLRDHTFDTTRAISLRCSKRTLLPSVGNVITDSRMYYHRCLLSKPPNKHLPLPVLIYRTLLACVTGNGSEGGGVNDDDDDDEDDVLSEDDVDEDTLTEAELEERQEGKERRRLQRKALRRRSKAEAKKRKKMGLPPVATTADPANDNDAASVADSAGGAGNEESSANAYPAGAAAGAATGAGAAGEGKEEEKGGGGDGDDDDSIGNDSGAEEEKEAAEAAQRAAMAAVTDFYKLVKKWHEHGLADDDYSDLPSLESQTWQARLGRAATRAKAKLRQATDSAGLTTPKVAPDDEEDDNEGEGDEGGAEITQKEGEGSSDGGGESERAKTAEKAGDEASLDRSGTAENGGEGKNDETKDVEKGEGEDDENNDDDEESVPPPPTAFQRMLAAATRVITGVKASPEDQAPPDPFEAYRAAEREREAAERANWFDANVQNTIFARDELRLEGPNRHLSDFSDATVLPPGIKPFPTEGPPVSACGSEYYDLKAANLDSVEE